MRVGVLLSVGMHPGSGRQRVSQADLAALRLAQASGEQVIGLHSGELVDVLEDYGAYGLRELRLVSASGQVDAVTGIAQCVAELGLDVLVAGAVGETPLSRGMLPYLVAEALSWRVIPAAVRLEMRERTWRAAARLDGAIERRYPDAGRCVLLARPGDTEETAYAADQRSLLSIRFHPANGRGGAPSGATPSSEAITAARMPQPPWMLPDPGEAAAKRLLFLRGDGLRRQGKVLLAPTPEQACEELFAVLHRNGLRIHERTHQGALK